MCVLSIKSNSLVTFLAISSKVPGCDGSNALAGTGCLPGHKALKCSSAWSSIVKYFKAWSYIPVHAKPYMLCYITFMQWDAS